MENNLSEVIANQAELLERAVSTLEKVTEQNEQTLLLLEQLRFNAALETQTEYFELVAANQLSYLETIKEVSSKGVGLARFGDGEILLASDPYRSISFQKGSHQLARELRDILKSNRTNLLVALPGMVYQRWWLTVISKNWPVLRSVIPPERKWGVYSVSRSSAFSAHRQETVEAWRSCWDGRDVTIVTGKNSRFDLVDPLFSGINPRFVYGPARNAYADVDRIMDNLLAEDRDLVLLSLGPTATALAARLADHGIQAIDVGHISASYNQVFNGAPAPEKLPVNRPQ